MKLAEAQFSKSIFTASQQSIPEEIRSTYKYLRSKKVLGELARVKSYPDEPQLQIYSCEYLNSKKPRTTFRGYGCDENKDIAITRAISEAIEYHCITHEHKALFVRGSYNELEPSAIDPLRFIPFSSSQLSQAKYKKFNFTHNTKLNWIEGYSISKKKKILIPASLAYANYSSRQYQEPIIRMPISTGAACGPNQLFAQYRGLCEVIERDSYVISFLPKMKKKLISIDQDDDIFPIKRRIERYNFEVHYVYTSLDNSVHTIVCILVDRSGSGPAVCVGLGGDLNPKKAIATASYEALRRHIANRDIFFQPRLKYPIKYSFEWSLWKKHQLWSAPHMIHVVEKIIKSTTPIRYKNLVNRAKPSYKKNMDLIINELNHLNYETLYIDMATPEVTRTGLCVVKVLCPEMVPLWRDDRYPYLGVERLHKVSKKFGVQTTLDLRAEEINEIYPF